MLIGRRTRYIVFRYCLRMTDKRQKATKVKCKGHECFENVNICGIYSSLEEAFEFCWSSFADEHNALPKSARKNVKLELQRNGWKSE